MSSVNRGKGRYFQPRKRGCLMSLAFIFAVISRFRQMAKKHRKGVSQIFHPSNSYLTPFDAPPRPAFRVVFSVHPQQQETPRINKHDARVDLRGDLSRGESGASVAGGFRGLPKVPRWSRRTVGRNRASTQAKDRRNRASTQAKGDTSGSLRTDGTNRRNRPGGGAPRNRRPRGDGPGRCARAERSRGGSIV